MIRVAINGFGRIGRTVARLIEDSQDLELIAINDVNPHIENMAYLFKYDSTYGRFDGTVDATEHALKIDGRKVFYCCEKDIAKVDWDLMEIDLVIDASGVGSNVLSAKRVTEETNVKKVLVTHSTDSSDREIIMGVNHDTLQPTDAVISNSICDANAVAHVFKWLHDEYEIVTGSITTLHPWLSYQNLTDGPAISQSNPGVVWKDFALGRASSKCLIPKNTTVMTAVERILPELSGRVLSLSYRVPTDIVASSDMTLQLGKNVTEDAVREFLAKKSSESSFIKVNSESLVSVDYERESASGVIDGQWLKLQNGLLKIVMWYDNEFGYCSRLVDLAKYAMK